MDWYYVVDNKWNGPHSQDKIAALLRSGEIDRNTLVWSPALDDWTPVGSVADLNQSLTPASAPPADPHGSAHRSDDGSRAVRPAAVPPAPMGADGKSDVDDFPDQPETSGGKSDGGLNSGDQKTTGAVTSTPKAGRPWLRFFARQFDTYIMLIVVGLLFELSLPRLWKDAHDVISGMNEAVLGLILFPVAMIQNALVITMLGNSLGKTLFGLRAVPVGGQRRFGLIGNVKRELRVWFGGYGLGVPLFALITMIMNYLKVRKGQPAIYDRNFADVELVPMTAIRRAFGAAAGVAVFLGIAGFLMWSEVQSITNEYQISQSESRPAELSKTAPSGNSWTNPITGLSATLAAGWVTETITAPKEEDIYNFRAPDGALSIYLAADETTSYSLDAVRYTKFLDESFAGKVLFTNEWSEISLDGVPMMRRSGTRLEDNLRITLLVRQSGPRIWMVMVVSLTDAGENDHDWSPVVKALVKTIMQPLSGSSTREDERSAQLKEQTVAGVAWTNPVTGLSSTLPVPWTHKEAKELSKVAQFDFLAPNSSNFIRFAWHDQTPAGVSLLQHVKRIEEKFSKTVLFDGEWERIQLDGRSVLQRSGQYRKNGEKFAVFVMRGSSGLWSIVINNRDRLNPGFDDAMPAVEALIDTLS